MILENVGVQQKGAGSCRHEAARTQDISEEDGGTLLTERGHLAVPL